MDFLFTALEGDEKLVPALTLKDHMSEAIHTIPVPSKSPVDYTVFAVLRSLSWLGYLRLILQPGQEPAMLSLAERIKKERNIEITLQKSPKYHHQSQGSMENANLQEHR